MAPSPSDPRRVRAWAPPPAQGAERLSAPLRAALLVAALGAALAPAPGPDVAFASPAPGTPVSPPPAADAASGTRVASVPADAGLRRAMTASPGTEPHEFSVLSYNTHGLAAWIAGDDPHRRHKHIGRLVNDYDVVLLQEDFLYHARLRRRSSHSLVARGNGPKPKWRDWLSLLLPYYGSGLSILAHEPEERLIETERERFEICAGWLSGGSDCFASKGFLRIRLNLAGRYPVDIYDLHLDAGARGADQRARLGQLALLRERIELDSDGAALIVGGDFNLARDEAEHREVLRAFTDALGLRDTGARPAEGSGWAPGVDYILYRSGSGVRLAPIDAGEAEEFLYEGAPLSDHPAVFARFRARSRTP